MNRTDAAFLIMRIGVAFAFLYPPFNALISPSDWIGYFPAFMRGIVPDPVLLHGFGLLEIIIALWILSGRKIFPPALAATAILLVIVALNLNSFVVVFRDLSIAAAALALAVVSAPSFKSKGGTV